jgi:hypothetical protein
MNNLIELFIDNFKGAACIRALNEDLLLFSNQAYDVMAHDALSIMGAIKLTDSPLEESNMIFCNFVEQKFKETLEPTFAGEVFIGVELATVRILIEYKNAPSILTLITDCDIKPSVTPQNKVRTCHTHKYMT